MQENERVEGEVKNTIQSPADVIVSRICEEWGLMVHNCTKLPFCTAVQDAKYLSQIERIEPHKFNFSVPGQVGDLTVRLRPNRNAESKIVFRAPSGSTMDFTFKLWDPGTLRKAAEDIQRRAWGVEAEAIEKRPTLDYLVLSVLGIAGAFKGCLGGKQQTSLHEEIIQLRPGIDPGARRYSIRLTFWINGRYSTLAIVRKDANEQTVGKLHPFKYVPVGTVRATCVELLAELLKESGHTEGETPHRSKPKREEGRAIRPSPAVSAGTH